MMEPIEQVVPEEKTPATPGKLLREARERLGMSIADAAALIRLAPRQIEALEADDLSRLPEMTFVRGFVRNYAKVLHLDVQPLLDALPQTKPALPRLAPASVDVPFHDGYGPQRQNLVWLGAAFLLSVMVAAFAVWHYTSPVAQRAPVELNKQMPLAAVENINQASQVVATEEASSSVTATMQAAMPASAVFPASLASAVPDVPRSAVASAPIVAVPARASIASAPVVAATARNLPATASVVTAPVRASVAPVPAASTLPEKPRAAPQSGALRMVFSNESWVDVRDRDGNIVLSQVNARGSELNLDGKAPLSLAIGRANSVRLYYKGKQVDLKPHTHATSEVARLTLE